MFDKRIEILHIQTEEGLLCGQLRRDLDSLAHTWTTFEEFLDEPLMEDDRAKEEMCELCASHPDYILWTLANI